MKLTKCSGGETASVACREVEHAILLAKLLPLDLADVRGRAGARLSILWTTAGRLVWQLLVEDLANMHLILQQDILEETGKHTR